MPLHAGLNVQHEICTAKRELNMNKLKKIPEFKTKAEERKFWESKDSNDYLDWDKAKSAFFPNLKPSTKETRPPLLSARLSERYAGLDPA